MSLLYKRLVMRAGFDPFAYAGRILATETANLIGYWPLWEASGTAAVNYSSLGVAANGAYTGVTLGQPGIGDGNTCPLFDGANDYMDGYSASFAGVFNGQVGSLALWGWVSDVGVWTDGTNRYLLYWGADGFNRIQVYHPGSADNRLDWGYRAGGTATNLNLSPINTTDWFHIALTWDLNAGATGEAKAFYNGSQADTTKTNLGTWVGSLGNTITLCGAYNKTPQSVWSGYVAHLAMWNKALTPAQILALAVV